MRFLSDPSIVQQCQKPGLPPRLSQWCLRFSDGLQKVSGQKNCFDYPLFKKCHSRCPEVPTFHCPSNLCTLEPLQRAGFSVATLEVLAVSWLPTKTITREWKLSRGAHSGSRHLKGKVSNFLRIKKISFHNFQNILIMSEIWKHFSLGSKPALFNVFLRYIFFKNIEISLLNLWKQDLNCSKVAMYQPLNKNATKKFMFTVDG